MGEEILIYYVAINYLQPSMTLPSTANESSEVYFPSMRLLLPRYVASLPAGSIESNVAIANG